MGTVYHALKYIKGGRKKVQLGTSLHAKSLRPSEGPGRREDRTDQGTHPPGKVGGRSEEEEEEEGEEEEDVVVEEVVIT